MEYNTTEQIAEAFRKVLGEGMDGDRAILIKRIPIICQDVIWIKRAIFGIFATMAALLVMFIAK